MGIFKETPTIPDFRWPGYEMDRMIKYDEINIFLFVKLPYHQDPLLYGYKESLQEQSCSTPSPYLSVHQNQNSRWSSKRQKYVALLKVSRLNNVLTKLNDLQKKLAIPTLKDLSSGSWLTISLWTKWQPRGFLYKELNIISVYCMFLLPLERSLIRISLCAQDIMQVNKMKRARKNQIEKCVSYDIARHIFFCVSKPEILTSLLLIQIL